MKEKQTRLKIFLKIPVVLKGRRPVGWPVTMGIPFAEGVLQKDANLSLEAGSEGIGLPLQTKVLARWKDGSIRWGLIDFLRPRHQAGKLFLICISHHFSVRNAPEKTRWGAVFSGRPLGGISPAPAALRADFSPRGEKFGLWVSRERKNPVCRLEKYSKGVAFKQRNGHFMVDTGAIRARLSAKEFMPFQQVAVGKSVCLSEKSDGIQLVDGRGRNYSAVVKKAWVFAQGPVRTTLAFQGEHQGPGKARCFSFQAMVHFWTGLDVVRVEYRIINDNKRGVFNSIQSLKLPLRGANPLGYTMGLPDGRKTSFAPGQPQRLFQRLDQEGRLNRKKLKGRSPGWVTVHQKNGGLDVAVRHFWQQWPQAISITSEGLVEVELFPSLEKDEYKGQKPWHKYYYLFDGQKYRIKTGMAKRFEVWFRFRGNGKNGGFEFAKAVAEPALAIVPPSYQIGTSAWGPSVSAGIKRFRQMDQAIANVFRLHLAAREAKGEYGLLNWGDWFGERTYNWGNCEYDLPWAALQQFARFGDERYFQVAEAAARHMADIDVVHAVNRDYLANDELRAWYDEIPAEPGCVYEHAIGHVGGYSKIWKQDYRTRHPGAYTWGDPRNLGHLWVKGLLYHHLLTGDPWTLDAAVLVGDHLVNTARQAGWDWHLPDGTHSGRGAGWPFRALTALADITGKPRYLNVLRRGIKIACRCQDPNSGGWLYQMDPGHCNCRTKHVGAAVFLTSILLNSLIEYCELTNDQTVRETIVRAVRFLIADAWVERAGCFRYTSCPASEIAEQTLTLGPLAFAALAEPGDAEIRRVFQKNFACLTKVLRARNDPTIDRVDFSYLTREVPRILYFATRIRGQKPHLTPPLARG